MQVIMKIIVKLSMIPLLILVLVTTGAAVMGIYRAFQWGESDAVVEAMAVLGANFGLLAGLLLCMSKLRLPGIKKRKPRLGSRTLRLRHVGSAPRIAIF